VFVNYCSERLRGGDECADESFGAAVVEVGFAEAGAEEVAAVVLLGHADLDGLGMTSRP